VQQIDAERFVARDAAITTSRLGVPSYWFESDTVSFLDTQRPLINPITGQPEVDPLTGQPAIDHQQLVTGSGNTVYLETLPIFYWPTIQTDLKRPTFYLTEAKFKHDRVFGTQVYTTWDAYQVFGLTPLVGTEWEFSADYLSERGPAGGTKFSYDRPDLFGVPGANRGVLDAWFIQDDGLDNLGRDRRALVPEEDFRGRAFYQGRHRLPYDLTLALEAGWISDRNFLEQYFEREWDEWKDQSTAIELRQILGNSSWTIGANYRVNDFFTENQWLPRGDHFWLGQDPFGLPLTWYEHTHAGFAKLRTANPPTDPTDAAKFDPLAWEIERQGERAATRQEIDFPFSAGWFRIVPYALGELAHWGEYVSGDDLQRAYGQVGVRASLPLWTAFPWAESELLNLHGLAHKVNFDVDASFAEANRDLDQFPLYDEVDDNSIEHFRRRFFFDSFGGMPGGNVPLAFDERYYAVRSGLGSWVTSPSTEIAEDLAAIRVGMRNRWQTKRGMPGQRRIIDWVVLDMRAVYFPEADRDDVGEQLGLAEYDFRWHVGDRVTLVSDGIFDLFDDGQRIVSVGGFLNRPPVGHVYLGVRSLEGPISANVLNASFSYRMSPKWITTFGTSVELGNEGNIGQQFALARIGESFLVRAGFNVDASRGSVGFNLAVEPRFWPKGRFARATSGAQVQPISPFELE
jgi:hypothetical protein